jgi:CDP-4-dehydro-6-deoxyglucose reductase/ferredoxin-NAD(P)+ reductase (naphthalene dioxygenase ferredoxin-specific)
MTAVHIKDWPTPIEIRRGTILDAALKDGVPVPYQCRSGECGSCKCRVITGRVEHDAHLPEALSEHEKSDGWVLACRARPKTDVEIDYDGKLEFDTPPAQQRRARVQQHERLNAEIVRLVLTVEGAAMPFFAGQFARLRFGNLPPRSYSMANLPGDRHLEFFIREMPGGAVSGHVARHLSVGDPVDIEGPFGNAYLRKSNPAAIIAVAGGSGLAPMLSIAREATLNQIPCPLHLYFGVRSESDLFAPGALVQMSRQNPRMSVHVVLSEQTPGQNRFRGGFPHEAIASDFTDLSPALIYSAGPPPMVAAVAETALALGAQTDNIYSDPFTSEEAEELRPSVGVIARGLGLLGRSMRL